MKYTIKNLQDIMSRKHGNLYLSGTGITALPEGLTVGGWLDLSGTGITALPEGLTVGGSLYLRGTGITALPEGLTVGGSLYLRGTGIMRGQVKQVKKLKQGDYEDGKYLYADNILIHVKRRVTFGKYIYYIGKIKGNNVISDGTNYAHCKNPKEGIADLEFKAAELRGAEPYKDLTPESELSYNDAVTAYRIITGACRAGTESFLNTLKEVKESYIVSEIIELTKGQYGNGTFRSFIESNRKE